MSTETSAPQLRPHFTPEPHRWIRPFGAPQPYWRPSRFPPQLLEFVVLRSSGDTQVVRYNVRLRETVDHGVPIGDFDRHAIGQKDYEELSEEVLAGVRKVTAAEVDVPSGAAEILRTTEEYIDTMEPVPQSDDESDSETGIEEAFPYPA